MDQEERGSGGCRSMRGQRQLKWELTEGQQGTSGMGNGSDYRSRISKEWT